MRKPYVLLLALTLILVACNGYMLFKGKGKSAPVKINSIIRLTDEGGNTFCSGTVVDDHTIITAFHCVVAGYYGPMPMIRTNIGIRGEEDVELRVKANVLGGSPQLDSAVLVGDFRAFKHMGYISDPERLVRIKQPKTEFTSCGYPMGGKLFCTKLIFQNTHEFAWEMAGVLIPGMSGGPTMFGDNLVAVNSAVSENNSLVNPIYNIAFKLLP